MRTKPRTFPLPSPPAGQDWSFMLSEIDQAILMSVTARLTTSAAVASRLPAIAYTDQSAQLFLSADCGQPQAASLAVTYTWARDFGLGLFAAPITGQRVSAPLPDAWLQPGDVLSTVTANIDVGDQWDRIILRYYTGERWLALQRELAVERFLGSESGD